MAALVTPSLPRGTLYLDFSAKSPKVRDAILAQCVRFGLSFGDVAIADPIETPDRPVELLISGSASLAVNDLFVGTRFSLRILNAHRPISTEVKLLRSTFTKGLEALLIETLIAAQRYGARTEIQRSLSIFLQNGFDRISSILVGTSVRHAKRRAEEMSDAADFVTATLGGAPMTSAAAALLQRLASVTDATGNQTGDIDDALRIIDEHLFSDPERQRQIGVQQ